MRFRTSLAGGQRPELDSQPSSGNAPPSIQLHIEELVLHGFAPGDRHRIAGAIEAELTRLLAGQPLPAGLKENASLDRIDGGGFRLGTNARPVRVGEQIAGAIHEGLNP